MKTSLTQDFQKTIASLHIWNKSILDILSKLNGAEAKVERATAKAVTGCGCIEIDGRKSVVTFEKKENDSQIRGVLCEDCKSEIEREIGETLYYMISLCNALNLSVDKIVLNELERVKTLGKYNLM